MGRLQKHNLAIVYRNQWLNRFPQHQPDRPYRPNSSIRLCDLGLDLLSLQCFLPATLNCYLATHGHNSMLNCYLLNLYRKLKKMFLSSRWESNHAATF